MSPVSLTKWPKECPQLTHLKLTECGMGPKHTADLAGIFSSGGCSIDTRRLARSEITADALSRLPEPCSSRRIGDRQHVVFVK